MTRIWSTGAMIPVGDGVNASVMLIRHTRRAPLDPVLRHALMAFAVQDPGLLREHHLPLAMRAATHPGFDFRSRTEELPVRVGQLSRRGGASEVGVVLASAVERTHTPFECL